MIRQRIELLARIGFFAKGTIYLLIGALAAMWAIGSGGQVSGGEGAIYQVATMPGGAVMLALLGVGLAAYACFRLYQAIADPQDDNIALRVARAASSVVHASLALACFQALGLASSGGGNKMTYLGKLLHAEGGRWIAVAIGVAIIGGGLYQIYNAWINTPADKLEAGGMSRAARVWTCRLGRFGLAARGVVFGIIGVSLIQAGLAASTREAKTTGGALREVSQQSYGAVLLAAVAVGLAAYGFYMIVSARHQRVPT